MENTEDKELEEVLDYLKGVYGETALKKIINEIKDNYDEKNKTKATKYIKEKLIKLKEDIKSVRNEQTRK